MVRPGRAVDRKKVVPLARRKEKTPRLHTSDRNPISHWIKRLTNIPMQDRYPEVAMFFRFLRNLQCCQDFSGPIRYDFVSISDGLRSVFTAVQLLA